MSTVIHYHIGSTFGNNCCLFQCFPYCLKLSCVHSLHVLDVCTRGNEDFLFRISVFSQHHVMSHPVHPIKTGQCGPYDDITSVPYTIHVNIHIPHYGCRMGPYNEFFQRYIYIPGFHIALALCRLLTLLPSFYGWWFQRFRSGFFYMYYIMSGIGWAVPYLFSCDCFEHCALVWLNVIVSFSLLIYGWKICFFLITSGLVQMLHKAYLLIIPVELLVDRYSERLPVWASKRRYVHIEFV